MPKVNVYLPDDLAEAVKASGVPLSAVCQRALEQAVRAVGDARKRKGGPAMMMLERFTDRARTVVRLAAEYAHQEGRELASYHVLMGLVAEGEGVAAVVLSQLGVSMDDVHAAVDAGGLADEGDVVYRDALGQALRLGHNYIGTEHLLLALADTDTELLSRLHLSRSAVKSQVISVLTGLGVPAPYKPGTPDINQKLDEILRRLEALERRLPA